MRRIIAILTTAWLLSYSLHAQQPISISLKIDVGENVTDVALSPDGDKWLITTATSLILWDDRDKQTKWQFPLESWEFPRRASLNNQYVYLIGPDRLKLKQIEVETGQELKEIEIRDSKGACTAIAINRLPGSEHEFIISAGEFPLFRKGVVYNMSHGSFTEGKDLFVTKPVKGNGGGLLRFIANGKFLKEEARNQVLYDFNKARDFDQIDTQLRKRWEPSKGTTYGYLASEDGKFVYQAHFWRSVNSKKEYLIEKSYLLTRKVVNSVQVEDQPVHFSMATNGDKILLTTAKENDQANQRWFLLDVPTWELISMDLPIKNPSNIHHDVPRNRNLVADENGGLWVLESGSNTGAITTYQLDGTKQEVSAQEMVKVQQVAKDEAAISKVKNDPKNVAEDPQYYIDMAFALSNDHKFQAAYHAFKKVYDTYPDDHYTNAFMGWFTMLSGTLEGVEPMLQKSIEIFPYNPIYHFVYSYYHFYNDDLTKAKAEIRKSIGYEAGNEGMGTKNTDWALFTAAGYTKDFTELDRWTESMILPDLQKRAQNLQRFKTAQSQTSPRNKFNQMQEVIRQEKVLKVPRAAILGAAMSEVAASGRKIGEVETAMQMSQESLEILRPYGDIVLLVGANTNAGHAHNQGFRFDRARPYYEEALRLMDLYEGQFEAYRVGALNGLGGVFDNQGEQNRALTYYEKALEVSRASGNTNDEAITLGNIATVNISQGQNVNQAIQMLNQGSTIYQRSGDDVALANNYNNIAFGLMLLNKPFQAIDYFKKAESLYSKLGMISGLAMVNNAIGKLLISYNKKIDAIAYYRKALQYIDEESDPEMAKTVYANLAGGLLGQEQYQEAASYAEKAIDLNEKLLQNADSKTARGIRSATNNYYRIVSLAKHRQSNYLGAFEAHERNRSRELLRKMGAGSNVSAKQVQGMLTSDQALIDYNVVHLYWEVHSHFFPVVVVNDKIVGREYSDSTLISSLKQEGEERFVNFMNQRSMLQQIRQYVSEKGVPENVARSLVRDSNLEKTIEFYRHLIKEPNARNELLRKSYARVFYDLLIRPIADQLEGKQELIIIPDGPLAFLPFETLINENGQYLAERYKIRYTQSATVIKALSDRKYSSTRKPLLAFGGPVFEELDASEGGVSSSDRGLTFNQLQQSYYAAEEQGASMRPTYIQMGFTKMTPLPGTIRETNRIKEIVTGTELYQNEDANENRLKSMAKANQLANYRVLHFATHGWAYSEIPELSTIVLGQYKQARGGEDGFLRVPEIEQLNLKADFVNLSACETALGKLYSSEGVVGLTQAFLVAGAKSISVTQWTVSDEGTAIFMTEMYRKVFQQQQSYLDAFAATKIEFIQGKYGDKFKHPDYWGPFCYYGI